MFFESPLRWAEVFTDDLRCKGNQKRFSQNYGNWKFGITFSSRKIPINDQWCSNNGLHSIIYGPISLWQGKRANLKTKVARKKKTPNFPKKKHFLPHDTYTHVSQGVRNNSFSENFECFVFLLPLFWDSPFCLIADEYTIPSPLCFFIITLVLLIKPRRNLLAHSKRILISLLDPIFQSLWKPEF